MATHEDMKTNRANVLLILYGNICCNTTDADIQLTVNGHFSENIANLLNKLTSRD